MSDILSLATWPHAPRLSQVDWGRYMYRRKKRRKMFSLKRWLRDQIYVWRRIRDCREPTVTLFTMQFRLDKRQQG